MKPINGIDIYVFNRYLHVAYATRIVSYQEDEIALITPIKNLEHLEDLKYLMNKHGFFYHRYSHCEYIFRDKRFFKRQT